MNTAPTMSLEERMEHLEAVYEYMLAYAAQGLGGDEESASVNQIREELDRAVAAMTGLGPSLRETVENLGLPHRGLYFGYIDVVERDTARANAAVALVLVQPKISSQLVDNLNASIHLRAMLTDLFLIDEILKLQSSS